MLVEQAATTPLLPISNVVQLHRRVSPRHLASLGRWLAAGGRMGLCDAMAYGPSKDGPASDHVLVWVRENPDPAYMVTPDGLAWCVTDCIRQQVLARTRSFEAALHFIRPAIAEFEAA